GVVRSGNLRSFGDCLPCEPRVGGSPGHGRAIPRPDKAPSGPALAGTSVYKLVRQELHQQPVDPRTVGHPLIATHRADPPETDLLVRADRVLVIGGRVDGDPMMTVFFDQAAGDEADGCRAHAVALDVVGEEEIDTGVAELGLGLLVALDRADDVAVDLDRVHAEVGFTDDQLLLDALLVERAPPPSD